MQTITAKKSLKRTAPDTLLPSAALSVPKKNIRYYQWLDKPPEVGDVVYGMVRYLGFHTTLENKEGRIHIINDGSRSVFVFGNRYAPDAFEGFVPEQTIGQVDMLARSGIVGQMTRKNVNVKDPTRVEILGYVCDKSGQVVNTRRCPRIKDPRTTKKIRRRSPMILVVGTSMNSGKSLAAASVCWALSTMGYKVRGAKVTGTASLKDILHMEDAGASPVADFTHFGYPSTYMLSSVELLEIFNKLDLKYANNPGNYWVVELADGVVQRETAMLLNSPEVKSRIHRLVFTASDALGALAGIGILKRMFGLVPDAVSGICSASPLAIEELKGFTDIPVVSNTQRDLKEWTKIIL